MRKRWFALLTATVAVACSGGNSQVSSVERGGVESGTLSVSSAGDGLLVEKADLDGNGQPDVWSYFRETVNKDGSKTRTLVKKTVDLNGDGRPDVTQYFDDAGDLVKEDLDLDFDGRVDVTRTYAKGKVASEDVSSRFDGMFDIRKFYEDGVLVLKQVDTRRTGRFDEYQYFVGNKLYRVGWDRDGDGKPEVFEENPAME